MAPVVNKPDEEEMPWSEADATSTAAVDDSAAAIVAPPIGVGRTELLANRCSGPELMSKNDDGVTDQPTAATSMTMSATGDIARQQQEETPSSHIDDPSSSSIRETPSTTATGQTTTTKTTTTKKTTAVGGSTSESYSDRLSKHYEKRRRDVEVVSDLAVTTATMATKSVWSYIRNIPNAWPRLYGIAFGVVVPVLMLLCISLFLGYFLAEFESQAEIHGNNEIIAARVQTARASDFLGNVSAQIPIICLSAYFISNTTTTAERGGGDDDWLRRLVQQDLYDIYVTDQSQHFNASTVEQDDNGVVRLDGDDVRDMPNYMRHCGAVVWAEAEKFIGGGSTSYYLTYQSAIGELSFDWIRCFSEEVKGASVPAFTAAFEDEAAEFTKIFGSYLRYPLKNATQLRPDVQAGLVLVEWTRHQRELEQQFLDELQAQEAAQESNATEQFEADAGAFIKARIDAFLRSTELADGFANCEASSDAGAWFWFTVMTTIGYGNGAPITFAGRLMVFTAGFFSILMFAVVLGNAGKTVTSITDDWISRLPRLSLLTRDWVICLFWGACYYCWMFFVAFITVRWKQERVGNDFAWGDAYWFAFITTTTVGLGDFYLEHEVLLRRDLIAFSLMILVGFIFLANFLVKLTDLLLDLFPWVRASNYQERLQETALLWGKSRRHLHVAAASTQHVEKSAPSSSSAAAGEDAPGNDEKDEAQQGAVVDLS